MTTDKEVKMMKDKKIADDENVRDDRDEDKIKDFRVWLEDLDLTPSAKALLILSYNIR